MGRSCSQPGPFGRRILAGLILLLGRVGEGGLADPGALVVGRPAAGEALGVAGAVARDDGLELVPVDRAEVVVAALGVPAEVRIGQGDAEPLGLRDRHVDEALAELVVGVPLDAPAHRLGRVGRIRVGRAEHHQRRPPGAVDRVLDHVALTLGAAHHRHQQLVALPLVERLLLADADHRPRVGAVGGAAERYLVADRGPVHQPADDADVGVAERGVVEDGGVLLTALDELPGEVGPVGAERLGRAVQVHAVAGLVLHLGQQDRLAAERGGAGDPVALGLHADDLRVRVLRDLPDHVRPVLGRHPVARLDPSVAGDGVLEVGLEVLLGGHWLRPSGAYFFTYRSFGNLLYTGELDQTGIGANVTEQVVLATADRAPRRRGRPGYDLEAVLQAAVVVFNERGYDGASMEDLSRRLGIAKSGIYHHVSGKEELLRMALDRALDGLWDAGERARGLDAPAIERLETLVRDAVLVLAERLPYVTLLLRVRGNTDVERAALDRRRAFDALVASLVEEAEAAGDIRPDIDPKLAARLLFGTVNSIVEWYRPGSSTSPDALADGVCAIAFDGLRVRK